MTSIGLWASPLCNGTEGSPYYQDCGGRPLCLPGTRSVPVIRPCVPRWWGVNWLTSGSRGTIVSNPQARQPDGRWVDMSELDG
jgi:hypothetical protein